VEKTESQFFKWWSWEIDHWPAKVILKWQDARVYIDSAQNFSGIRRIWNSAHWPNFGSWLTLAPVAHLLLFTMAWTVCSIFHCPFLSQTSFTVPPRVYLEGMLVCPLSLESDVASTYTFACSESEAIVTSVACLLPCLALCVSLAASVTHHCRGCQRVQFNGFENMFTWELWVYRISSAELSCIMSWDICTHFFWIFAHVTKWIQKVECHGVSVDQRMFCLVLCLPPSFSRSYSSIEFNHLKVFKKVLLYCGW
jgi:hypothetical protein